MNVVHQWYFEDFGQKCSTLHLSCAHHLTEDYMLRMRKVVGQRKIIAKIRRRKDVPRYNILSMKNKYPGDTKSHITWRNRRRVEGNWVKY